MFLRYFFARLTGGAASTRNALSLFSLQSFLFQKTATCSSVNRTVPPMYLSNQETSPAGPARPMNARVAASNAQAQTAPLLEANKFKSTKSLRESYPDLTCAAYFSKEGTEIRACNGNEGLIARLRLTMATRNRTAVTVSHNIRFRERGKVSRAAEGGNDPSGLPDA